MQRILPKLLLAVPFLWVNSASSQGFHLGLNIAPNVSFSDARELTHHPNGALPHFGYGFIFDAMFTDNYAIGTGVNVFYAGGSVQYFEEFTGLDGAVINRVELDQRLQYVEIPLTFKMRTKEVGYTTYYGQFGIGLGLNVRAEGSRTMAAFAKADSTGALTPLTSETGPVEAVSLVDQTLLFRPSYIIGLGWERRFTGTTALAVGIRYNMAMRNQYQEFSIYQSNSADQLLLEFDEDSGQELPVASEMRGKTGQVELCVGLMF